MISSLTFKAPPAILVLALFCFLVTLLSRGLFLAEDPPAFVLSEQNKSYVGMSGEGLVSGVRQFSDDADLMAANILTVAGSGDFQPSQLQQAFSVKSGDSVIVVKKGLQISLLHGGWLPAAQRVALGAPLHPDQMSRSDWLALPGIGDVLADRIEVDRQKNGEYGSLQALSRVKGVGKKRIEKWSEFF